MIPLNPGTHVSRLVLSSFSLPPFHQSTTTTSSNETYLCREVHRCAKWKMLTDFVIVLKYCRSSSWRVVPSSLCVSAACIHKINNNVVPLLHVTDLQVFFDRFSIHGMQISCLFCRNQIFQTCHTPTIQGNGIPDQRRFHLSRTDSLWKINESS